MSGKVGDKVFVHSNKYPYHFRSAVKPGSKREEKAFKEQFSRTTYLNQLAGELNRTVENYCGAFKAKDFYANLHRRFRKEATNHRLLLLRQLKCMEVNERYPLMRLGSCDILTTVNRNYLQVNLKPGICPPPGIHKADCYYYDVLLLKWGKKENKSEQLHHGTEWIPIRDDMYRDLEFEIRLPIKPGDRHWLLMLGCNLGVGEEALVFFPAQALQIVDAGTFDKKELALLNRRKPEEKGEKFVKKMPEVRVKGKVKRQKSIVKIQKSKTKRQK